MLSPATINWCSISLLLWSLYVLGYIDMLENLVILTVLAVLHKLDAAWMCMRTKGNKTESR